MREADVDQVFDQFRGEFAIGERAVAFFGHAPPGTEMHLIYSDWPRNGSRGSRSRHPGSVIK